MSLMSDDLCLQWEEFLEGEWTKEPPTKEGSYAIADHLGQQTGATFIAYRTEDGLGFAMHGTNSKKASDVWESYFWSVAVPPLPPVEEAETAPSRSSWTSR